MKAYAFPAQEASDDCPKVPRAVRVVAESLWEATQLLSTALKNDPELKNDHPEFGERKEPKKTKSSPTK